MDNNSLLAEAASWSVNVPDASASRNSVILLILSWMDVLLSSHSVPACFAEDTASSTECWYALNADTAAVTPAATRISGFAINVAHKPDNAPDKENVDAAAVPSAADNPIAATAAWACPSVIPWDIKIAVLWASDSALLDNNKFVWDSDNPLDKFIKLENEFSDISEIFDKSSAFEKSENSLNISISCLKAYTPPAVPSPASADCNRFVFATKSAIALEPSRNPEYKSLDTVVVARFSRLAFNAFVFASRDVK